jgi:hypothetical protein
VACFFSVPPTARQPRPAHRWAALDADGIDELLGMVDIPWPPSNLDGAGYLAGLAREEVRRAAENAESPASPKSARRAAYRRASLRWHPDSFMRRVGRRVREGEREEAAQRAAEVAQSINGAWTALRNGELAGR